METLYIVMPVYNEKENIEQVVSDWYPILDMAGEDSRLVAADGGSNDGTLEILNGLKEQYPKLEVMSYPGTDHGTKVVILYRYAIENNADWIFQTDSDGQTLPEEFKDFWDNRNEYDVIIGNRIKRGDGFMRKMVELVLRIYIKCFFGVMVPDANAPYRLMRCGAVNKYIELLPDNLNLPNALLTAFFVKFKESCLFREVTFRQRQGGKNHMRLKLIFNIGLQSLVSFGKIRKDLVKYDGNGHELNDTTIKN